MNVGAFNRRTVGRLILLAWASSLAWLARREFGKNEQQVLAEATIRLNPEAHFFAVGASGHQIGYASITVDTIGAGFRVAEVMALDVPEADSVRRVTRRTELVLSRSLRLREFERTLTGGGLYEQLSGTVVDSVIRFRKRDSREKQPIEWALAVSGDVVLAQVLPYRLAFSKRLEVGRSVTANVLDLSSGLVAPVVFTATAESTFVVADSAVEQRALHRWVPITFDTIQAYRIEHVANGTPMVSWVDAHGGLVGSEAAFGVRLERSAFELVSFNYRDHLASIGPKGFRDLPAMRTLIASGQHPDTGSSAAYSITSQPVERFLLPRLAWLAGGRQTASGTELKVGAPAKGPTGAQPRAEYLDPEPGLPPVDPTVRTAAAIVIGDETDPIARVRRLAQWVARGIAIDTAHDAPLLAPTVLAAKKAGAEGHAELFTELARAVGIRSRPVGGVAVRHGLLLGHAWSEVWVGGEWLAVDPTFGHVPASPELVRVAIGGGGRAIDLVPFLGSAKFESVSPSVSP